MSTLRTKHFQNVIPRLENSIDPELLITEKPADQNDFPPCNNSKFKVKFQHWTGWKSEVVIPFTSQKELDMHL